MGRFVIASYTPKPGREADLAALVSKHMGVLRAEGLVTERPAYAMRAKDGTILEVFEWLSAEAVEAAHTNASVMELWGEFGEVCDFRPLAGLAECEGMFAEFEPIP
jgi:hypothetical protein